MKRHIIKFIFPFAVLIVSGFMVGVALAADYLGAGHFPTNQITRCHSGVYATENQNASAKWSYTTDLDIYYGCTGNNVWTIGGDYGQNGFYGWVYICFTDGTCWDGRTGSTPVDKTYSLCYARSNSYYLASWTSTQRQFNATHELGHCWSLAHRPSDTTSVMQTGQLSIIEPNSTDISLVNARY